MTAYHRAVRLLGIAVVVTGCYAPAPATGVPCASNLSCPGDQVCDTSVVPPICGSAVGVDGAPPIDTPPGFGPWFPPEKVALSPIGFAVEDPSLTSDQRQLYFVAQQELWFSQRATPNDPWTNLSTLGHGPLTAAHVFGNGEKIYLSRRRAGDGELAVVARTGSSETVSRIFELAGSLDTTDPSVSLDGLTLVFSREAPGGLDHELFESTRAAPDQPWSPPRHLLELGGAGREGGPMLSADQLSIYFHSERSGDTRLYVATRETRDGTFGPPTLIHELGQGLAVDQDPWISPNGRELYFASDRAGTMAIYRSTR